MALVWILLFLLIASGIGKYIRSQFISLSELENFILDSGVGFGVLSYIIFSLNFLHLIVFPVQFLIIGVLSAIAFKNSIYYAGLFINFLKAKYKTRLSFKLNFNNILIILLFINITIIFISLFTPPTSSDAIAYHMTVPKLYIQNKGYIETPFIIQSATPFNIEMLYQWGLWFGNYYTSKMIHFMFFVFILVLLYTYSIKWFSNKFIGILSLAFFVFNSFSLYFASTAYITFGVSFYIIGASLMFMEWLKTRVRGYLIISAIYSGLAAASKTTALGIILIFSIIAFITELLNRKKIGVNFILYGALSALLCAPWYIKNWIILNNPVWPYMYNIFKGKYLDVRFLRIIIKKVKQYGYHDFKHFFTLFYDMTFKPKYGTVIVNYGVLFLSMLPGVFIVKKNKNLFYMIGYIIIFSILFYFLTQQYRFMVHIIFFLAILISVIFYSISYKKVKIIFQIIFIMHFLFFSVFNAGGRIDRFKFIMGLSSTDQYLSSKIPEYRIYQYANKTLSKKDYILVFAENLFYLDIPFFCGKRIEQNVIKFKGTPDKIYQIIKDYGFSYMIYAKTSRPFKSFKKFKAKYLIKIKEDKDVMLLKVI